MVFGSYLLVNFILPEPNPSKPEAKVAFGVKYNLPKLAASGYQELMEQEPDNPDHYVGLIRQNKTESEELNRLSILFARQARQSRQTSIANANHLAAGLCQAFLGNHFQAIFHYNKVSDVELRYLNYAFGMSYMGLRRYSKAKVYLEHELKIPGGYYRGASQELFRVLSITQDDEGKHQLIKTAQTCRYLSPEDLRSTAFAHGEGWLYLTAIFKMLLHHFNMTGFLAAMGVMLVWLVFLLKLDIFDPEKIQQVLLILGLGMVMSFGVFVMADIRQLLLNMGDAAHGDNYFYWVLDVGAVEEFVKIVPLIGLMLFTKWLDEPFDYILYASVSALGFAFIENGLYYDGIQLNIIHARAMTAVVGHMFHTSIIAYGIVLCKYRFTKVPLWGGIGIAFVIASLSHGLYDFLLGKGMYLDALDKEVYPAFVLFFLLIILLWTHFINNSLNQSPFFDYKHRFRPYKLMYYLVIALTAVLVFEYLTVGMHYGPTIANLSLLKASINGSFMILVLALGLSRIELKKGEWRGLRWQHVLPYSRTEEGRIRRSADRKDIIDSQVQLSAYAFNPQMKTHLAEPQTASIIRQLSLSLPGEKGKDTKWYLAHTEMPMSWEQGLSDQFLIKFKSKDEFNRKGETLALLLAIPDQSLLEAEAPSRDQFNFLGWIRIQRSQSFPSVDKMEPEHP
jgi:RsiW-degrading membrane proteinase PrsW (M82 family)